MIKKDLDLEAVRRVLVAEGRVSIQSSPMTLSTPNKVCARAGGLRFDGFILAPKMPFKRSKDVNEEEAVEAVSAPL